MKKLIAEFSAKLPSFVLLSGPQNRTYSGFGEIDGFNVTVELVPYENSMTLKSSSEQYPKFGAIDAKIIVSKDEDIYPPDTLVRDDKEDNSARYDYFLERTGKYQNIALKAINRVIGYFRYKLHNPLLRKIEFFSQESMHNPKWMDENGTVIKNVLRTTVFQPIPGISDIGLNTGSLAFNNLSELENALQNEFVPELHEEILADAQDAIYQDNSRRAVLEMAIAVEVVIRTTYFGHETISGATIDYLEDKGRVNLKVIELIDSVAKQVFSSSFREFDRDAFNNIDFLFRCRNKAAHRGELIYRDDQGKSHKVDRSILITWWKSIFRLFEWLGSIQMK